MLLFITYNCEIYVLDWRSYEGHKDIHNSWTGMTSTVIKEAGDGTVMREMFKFDNYMTCLTDFGE